MKTLCSSCFYWKFKSYFIRWTNKWNGYLCKKIIMGND